MRHNTMDLQSPNNKLDRLMSLELWHPVWLSIDTVSELDGILPCPTGTDYEIHFALN